MYVCIGSIPKPQRVTRSSTIYALKLKWGWENISPNPDQTDQTHFCFAIKATTTETRGEPLALALGFGPKPKARGLLHNISTFCFQCE